MNEAFSALFNAFLTKTPVLFSTNHLRYHILCHAHPTLQCSILFNSTVCRLMSTEPAQPADDERTKWSPWAIAAALILLLIFGVIAFGTVRGCFFVDPQDPAKLEEEQKKKEEEEKKDKSEFKLSAPIVMPSEPKTPLPLVKPGHWETTSQEMRANYRDFVGDSRSSIVDAQNRPFPVAKTPFDLRASRPVLLSKGRPKTTETTIFIPVPPITQTAHRKACISRPNSKNAASASANRPCACRSRRCPRTSITS